MRRVATLLVVLVALAGCGGTVQRVTPRQPHMPRALADPWRAQADAVAAALAAGDGCLAMERAMQLRLSVISAVNRHLLAPRFQEQLVGAVNELTSRIRCVPPAPAPTPPAPVVRGKGHGHEKHGKHDEHGKHGKHGGDD